MGRGAGRAESRFAAARPGTAGVYTPRPRYGGQIAFWGLGAERQTGFCATQREGGRLDNLALQNCLLPTELVIQGDTLLTVADSYGRGISILVET